MLEKKEIKEIGAVLFDLDGTVTDTEKYYYKAWPKSLEHFGYETWEDMALELRSLGKPYAVQKFREWYGEDFDYEGVRTYRRELVKKYMDEYGINLKPGVTEVLAGLRKKDIYTALVTANEYARTEKLLKKCGLDGRFDKVICADMVDRGKPAPDIYAYACETLGIEPQKTLAVEDSPNGIYSAYEAGCNVVMVPDLSQPDDELNNILYKKADSLIEILDMV